MAPADDPEPLRPAFPKGGQSREWLDWLSFKDERERAATHLGFLCRAGLIVFCLAAATLCAISFLYFVAGFFFDSGKLERHSSNLIFYIFQLIAIAIVLIFVAILRSGAALAFGFFLVGALIVPTVDIFRYVLILTGSDRSVSEFIFSGSSPSKQSFADQGTTIAARITSRLQERQLAVVPEDITRLYVTCYNILTNPNADGSCSLDHWQTTLSRLSRGSASSRSEGNSVDPIPISPQSERTWAGFLQQSAAAEIRAAFEDHVASDLRIRGVSDILVTISDGSFTTSRIRRANQDRLLFDLAYLRSEGLIVTDYNDERKHRVTDFGKRIAEKLALPSNTQSGPAGEMRSREPQLTTNTHSDSRPTEIDPRRMNWLLFRDRYRQPTIDDLNTALPINPPDTLEAQILSNGSWFKVSIPSNSPGTYRIDVVSSERGAFDPLTFLLRHRAAAPIPLAPDDIIAIDDDGGELLNSRITRFLQQGLYYLYVTSAQPLNRGTVRINVRKQ